MGGKHVPESSDRVPDAGAQAGTAESAREPRAGKTGAGQAGAPALAAVPRVGAPAGHGASHPPAPSADDELMLPPEARLPDTAPGGAPHAAGDGTGGDCTGGDGTGGDGTGGSGAGGSGAGGGGGKATGHPDSARPVYAADGPSLFRLALGGALLSILTLGIYRFWLTAALRRHYWHALRIAGDPLEYTGTGLEKLVGFLFALVLLAVYLGLVNLGLTFVGLSYFQGNPAALQLSLLAVVPLFFFAQYRARRYVLARTRWRGIRFGMDRGAFAYTLRAMGFWLLTIATLGLLYPLQQFRLNRFMIERSWFGDLRFAQGGSWVGLFAYWVWLYVVAGVMAVIGWAMAADAGNPTTAVFGGVVMFIGYLSLVVLFMRYEVAAFRYMWSNRRLGGARFTSAVTPGEIIGIYVGGSLLTALATALMSAALLLALWGGALLLVGQEGLAALLAQLGAALGRPGDGGGAAGGAAGGALGPVLAGGALVLFYLVSVAFGFAFSHIFVIRPVLRRKAETLTIAGVASLVESRQRPHDPAAEAGGFADALGVDLGAGF